MLNFNRKDADSWRRKQPIISPLTLFIDGEDTLWAKVEPSRGPIALRNKRFGYRLESQLATISEV